MNRSNIDELDVNTFIFKCTPQMIFHIFCATNLRGGGGVLIYSPLRQS